MPQLLDALADLRELRQRFIERQLFVGYSGMARAIGGIVALAGAAVMSHGSYPATVSAFVAGWGMVAAAAILINYSGMLLWFVRLPRGERNLDSVRPAFEAFPPLLTGGLLTFALLQVGAEELLYGMWMCLFGLVNLSSKHILPRQIAQVGWFYIACGGICLYFRPGFLNPWPMGAVFFVGELAGGWLFYRHRIECTGRVVKNPVSRLVRSLKRGAGSESRE